MPTSTARSTRRIGVAVLNRLNDRHHLHTVTWREVRDRIVGDEMLSVEMGANRSAHDSSIHRLMSCDKACFPLQANTDWELTGILSCPGRSPRLRLPTQRQETAEERAGGVNHK